jgi:hypothetical protein
MCFAVVSVDGAGVGMTEGKHAEASSNLGVRHAAMQDERESERSAHPLQKAQRVGHPESFGNLTVCRPPAVTKINY